MIPDDKIDKERSLEKKDQVLRDKPRVAGAESGEVNAG